MADAVKVEGLKQLTSDLKKLEAGAPKKLRAISKDAATIVSNEAKTIVPVRTGKLRGKIKPGATQKGAYVKAGPVVYAPVIHFGWPRHNIAPQPFLYEALDARRDEVIERFAKGVHDLVEQTVHSGTRLMAKPEIRVGITTDFDNKGNKKAITSLGGLKTAISDTTGIGNKFSVGMSGAFDLVKQNAGLLAAGAATALAKFSLDAVHKFEDTAKAALDFRDKSGLASVEVASQWLAVADDFKVSQSDISTAMLNVTKTIEQSKWKEYGIATHDAGGEVRNVNDVFIDTLDMLGKIQNPTERARVGTELFGKAWGNVAPLVGKAKDGYKKLLDTVSDGQTITDKEAEKAEKMRLAEDALSDAFGDVQLAVGQLVAAGAPLIEVLSTVVEKMAESIEKATPVVDWMSKMADTAVGLVSGNEDVADSIDLQSASLGDLMRFLVKTKANVDEVAAAVKAWSEVHTIAAESVKESDRETRKLTTSTEGLQHATETASTAITTIEEDVKAATREAANLDAQWKTLKGTLTDDQAAIDVENQFATVKTAGEEAWKAAAEGAADADQKARDYESALISLKLKVIDYAQEVGGLPPEQVTKILADIDSGSIATANQALDAIAHARQVIYNAQVAAHREYATGTTNAAPGLALVNEGGNQEAIRKGGQWMLLGGGEQIANAQQTKRLFGQRQASGPAYVDNSVTNVYLAPGVSPQALIKAQRRTARRGLAS